jgi:UDP-N-acetylglucosamine:LPS N-acetylglucosamine transferase
MTPRAAPPDRRRALILSGSLGKGHDTVAEASAAALEPWGVASTIVDSMALLGGPGSRLGDWVFRTILGAPPVYDAFHFNQLRPGRGLARAFDRAALHVMWPRFLDQVADEPPDLVLSVFATGAAAGARYKARGADALTAVFITDSFAHAMWVHEETDVFLVTSAVCATAVKRYRPRARVAVVTHPTRPMFYAAPSRGAARERLGVPADARCALLMSGAWGLGPVADCAAALARDDVWVLAVAGANARLEGRLRALAAVDRRVVPFGFTDRVPELMAASDVVVSSSGDTCREARVVGRGLILFDVVPGHGRENLAHELELGNAAVCSPTPASVAASVTAFLDDPAHGDTPPVTSPAAWESEFRAALASAGF